MADTLIKRLVPAVTLLAGSAVAFSGFGGIASSEAGRVLCGAGAGFCLLMLIVPGIFLSSRYQSVQADNALYMAVGALLGACFTLYFESGSSWLSLIGNVLIGAGLGFIMYWVYRLRSLGSPYGR